MPTSMIRGNGENVNHVNAIRLRLKGSGNLRLNLFGLEDSSTVELVDLVMAVATNVEPVRLTNFTQQRIQLEIRTSEIDEYFQISKIIIFSKAVATGYPG